MENFRGVRGRFGRNREFVDKCREHGNSVIRIEAYSELCKSKYPNIWRQTFIIGLGTFIITFTMSVTRMNV